MPKFSLQIAHLQKAKEDRVHGHLIDAEEDVGDKVGAQCDDHDRDEVIVQIRLIDVANSTYVVCGKSFGLFCFFTFNIFWSHR